MCWPVCVCSKAFSFLNAFASQLDSKRVEADAKVSGRYAQLLDNEPTAYRSSHHLQAQKDLVPASPQQALSGLPVAIKDNIGIILVD